MQNIYAIILAGGSGARINGDLPKQFLKIRDIPIIIHTVQKFDIPEIKGIILALPEKYIDYGQKLIEDFTIKNVIKIIAGGETRQYSSYNAVNCFDFSDEDILIFHDAARPFVSEKIICSCINEAKKSGASGVYINAIDTIARIEGDIVDNILSRNKLFYTQTPQVFKYKIIKNAHELAISKGVIDATDDVSLVMDAGYKVSAIEGDYKNIKITTPLDLQLAEFLLNLWHNSD